MEFEEENAKLGNMERKTVRFNVGGTIYEVSRTLIDQFPDTMLARLSSETWSPESNLSTGEPLFIERDGDRFRYCLDYMRDGGIVDLPATVSKAAMLRDLEYYGFQEVDPSTISQAPSITNEDFRKAWTKNYWQLQENAKKSEQDAQNDNDVAQLARVCATLVSGRPKEEVSCIFEREEGGMMVIECMRLGTTYRKHGSKEQIRKIYAVHNTAKRLYLKSDWYVSRFQNHLKRHGLMFVKCEESKKSNCSSLLDIYLKTL